MEGIKVRQVEFNIGTTNLCYSEEDIKMILNRSGFNNFDTTPVYYEKGEWMGDEEPTLLINTSTTMDDDAIHAEVEGLCRVFRQTAIAILVDNNSGALIYHPHYDKLKLTFDRKYFLDTYNKNYNKNFK